MPKCVWYAKTPAMSGPFPAQPISSNPRPLRPTGKLSLPAVRTASCAFGTEQTANCLLLFLRPRPAPEDSPVTPVCCRHLAGRLIGEKLCRRDAGSTLSAQYHLFQVLRCAHNAEGLRWNSVVSPK